MSQSWAKEPLGFKDGQITIECTKEQAGYIKENGCIAYNDICDASFCDKCPYNPNLITFRIKKPISKEINHKVSRKNQK